MRLLLSALTLILLQLIPSPGFAQEDPRKKQAEAPFQQGLNLHDQGRDAEALDKFREAHRIYPSANALFQIARSEELIGRDLDALRHYREALKSPVLHPRNAELGRRYVAGLERRLGRIEILGPPGLTVTVQGRDYRLPLDEPIDVEPGTVEATGTYGKDRYQGRALGVAGSVATMSMAVIETASSAPSHQRPPETSASATRGGPEEFWTGRRVGGAVTGSAGFAALAGGMALLLAAHDEGRAGRDATAAIPTCLGVDSPACREGARAAEAESALRSAAAACFVGGGVLTLTGGALVLWPSTSAKPTAGAGSRSSSLDRRRPGAMIRLRGSMLEWQQWF